MNIVLAQLKKDIQCQRRPLILWGICLGIGGILFTVLAALNHSQSNHLFAVLATRSHSQNSPLALPKLSDTQMVVGLMSVVALSITCLTTVGFGMFLLVPILVIRVVHEDTLIETTAFWRTRPIPREKLLLAKVLFIAVLLAPLIVAGGNGARIGDAHFWPAEIAWITALAALSSITPGMQAVLGYGLAFLFGKFVFSGIINRLWIHFHGEGALFSDGLVHQFLNAALLLHLNAADFYSLCYLAGYSAVFIHQYLTLRTRRSIAIFVATLVVVSLLQMLAGPSVDTSASPVIRVNSRTWKTP